MGASRHRRHGVHGIGLGNGAARTDRCSGGDIRGVRARAGTLNTRRARALIAVGLGLVAGAILQRPLAAQVRDTIPKKRDTTLTIPAPVRADSMLRDSLAKKDSIERARIRGDTIKSPLAQAEIPIDVDIGRRLHWNRDALFATGVVDVADLLERVQGLTTLHTGWVSSPVVGAYLGDVRRVRVFYDGVELTALDPRHNGALDL